MERLRAAAEKATEYKCTTVGGWKKKDDGGVELTAWGKSLALNAPGGSDAEKALRLGQHYMPKKRNVLFDGPAEEEEGNVWRNYKGGVRKRTPMKGTRVKLAVMNAVRDVEFCAPDQETKLDVAPTANASLK